MSMETVQGREGDQVATSDGLTQLVVQFPEAELEYDALIALENELIEALADHAYVDGHDRGSGESNIFILTAEPQPVFAKVLALLQGKGLARHLKAAYRDDGSDDY